MAKKLLSVAKNWGVTIPVVDTYIPSLEDAANIEDAFKLFMYGTTNESTELGDKSLYSFLSTTKTTADSANSNANSHIGASGGVHGLASGVDVVGTTSSQTLSNKTFISPVVTGTISATGNVIGHIDVIEKTSSYTLSLSDDGKMLLMNSASANILTIPAAGFAVGTQITVAQTGSGQTTLSPIDGSVTIGAVPGLKLRTQWSAVTLVKISANSWFATGDLSA